MRIRRHFLVAAAAVVASMVWGPGAARADFVLGNIPPTYTSPTYNTNGQINTGLGTNYAVEFSATANETITLATLILTIQRGTTPTLGIYTATANNTIGSLVGAFASANLTFGTAVSETFTGSATLSAGRNYFLVLDGNNFFNWSSTFTATNPNGLTPIGLGATYLASGGSGSYAAGNVKPSFQLETAAVPEPSSLALSSLGGLTLLVVRRLRSTRLAGSTSL